MVSLRVQQTRNDQQEAEESHSTKCSPVEARPQYLLLTGDYTHNPCETLMPQVPSKLCKPLHSPPRNRDDTPKQRNVEVPEN